MPEKGISPAAKIVGVAGFVAVCTFIKDYTLLLFSLAFVLLALAVFRVRPSKVVKMYAAALPFIVFSSLTMLYFQGWAVFLTMLLRITTCVLAVILLVLTTGFTDMVYGMSRLGLPRIMVELMVFTYRYISLLSGELSRMKSSRRVRGFTGGKHLLDRTGMRILAYTVGMGLVRAYRRGCRIQDSLEARMYSGKFPERTAAHHAGASVLYAVNLILFPALLLYIDVVVG